MMVAPGSGMYGHAYALLYATSLTSTTMSTSAMSTPPAPSQPAGEEGSFFDNILTPGSSLNSTFLAILDTVFAALLCILLSLVWLTGSIHFVFLVLIELGLWGSVKWYYSFISVQQFCS